MHSQAYIIELLEDLVISQRSATLGGHRGLDYVPGQTLLGACSARLYRSLGSDAYAVFHSGAVRFGNAFCLDPPGRPVWPVPLCWHQKKGESPKLPGEDRLDAHKVFNLQHGDKALEGAQPKQMREGYVNAGGILVKPQRAMRMKTAIEPGTGRAAEAQFFGYDALARSARLGGWIEADADIGQDLFDRIVESLTGTVLIGRSRSAEYGRARFEPVTDQLALPESGPVAGRELTLWLLSDLALTDELGQPTLDPDPARLGLGEGEIDWAGSFLRSRRYAPWNSKRGAPDLERWVIQQGSVIHLRLDQDPDPKALMELCAAGLGMYRECGLGRVWINPPLLAEMHPTFPAVSGTEAAQDQPGGSETADTATANDPLILWLASQIETEDSRERIEAQARKIAERYRRCLVAARRELGITSGELFGPSRSQWGRVLETARSTADSKLTATLFDGGDAVVKHDAEGWKEEFFDGSRRVRLADWLKSELSTWICDDSVPKGSTRDLPRLVQRLAHLCRTDTEKRAQ